MLVQGRPDGFRGMELSAAGASRRFLCMEPGEIGPGLYAKFSAVEAPARPSIFISRYEARRIALALTTTMDPAGRAEVVGDACLSREASAGADGSKVPTSLGRAPGPAQTPAVGANRRMYDVVT